jgi:hypothetical protein
MADETRKDDSLRDKIPDGSFFEELANRPECEFVGGPYDGVKFHLPETETEKRFRDSETDAYHIYRRVGNSNIFSYFSREPNG